MSKHRHDKSLVRLAALCCASLLLCAGLGAQEIRARWQLESNSAMTGQGLALTIEIQGIDAFEPPSFTVPGVDVQWQGGGPRNSTSVVSMNGRTTTTVRKSFVGSWSLKASRSGTYHVDSLTMDIQGTQVRLAALDWQVQDARQSDNFFLRQEINPPSTVLGLELEYRLIWYIGQSAQNPDFTFPLLDAPGIELLDQANPPTGRDALTINYRGHQLAGIKSSEVYQGKQYTTLRFDLRVKANQTGTIDLSGTAITFQGVVGTHKVRDLFGDVVEEPEYDTLVARAQPLKLVVTDLPAQGKPAVFSGLIGKLELAWSQPKPAYQVGEPIRLDLNLKGVQNKPDLDLDHMVVQALDGTDFSVSPDSAPGASGQSDGMIRSYVLRARHEGSLDIPPLKLNYFDPQTRSYGETATQALSLMISAPTGPAFQSAQGTTGGSQGGAPPFGGAASPALDPALLEGIPLNPPGVTGKVLSPLPWLILALPGLILGLGLGLWGIWLHSPGRLLRLSRQDWLESLLPLEHRSGRAALEEGREKLLELACRKGPWPEHLELKGIKSLLDREIRDWDEGYFSAHRDQEDWAGRFDRFAQEGREWK